MFAATAQQMKEIDSIAINRFHIPGILLMENAARACVQVLKEYFLHSLKSKNIVILCGRGNNGGDGFAIARLLHEQCAGVTIVKVFDGNEVTVDSSVFYNAVKALDIPMLDYRTVLTFQKFDIIIDAVYGTGFHGKINERYVKLFEAIRNCDAFKLAVDVPSGLDCDTGKIAYGAVHANVTVTFTCPKIGFYLHNAWKTVGKLVVQDISIPCRAVEAVALSVQVTDEVLVNKFFPQRYAASHKGTYGKVGSGAGSIGLTGAA